MKIEKCTANAPSNCTIHEVRINPCNETVQKQACRLKRGHNASIEFDYTPSKYCPDQPMKHCVPWSYFRRLFLIFFFQIYSKLEISLHGVNKIMLYLFVTGGNGFWYQPSVKSFICVLINKIWINISRLCGYHARGQSFLGKPRDGNTFRGYGK